MYTKVSGCRHGSGGRFGLFKEGDKVMAEIAKQIRPGDNISGHGTGVMHHVKSVQRQLRRHAKIAVGRRGVEGGTVVEENKTSESITSGETNKNKGTGGEQALDRFYNRLDKTISMLPEKEVKKK